MPFLRTFWIYGERRDVLSADDSKAISCTMLKYRFYKAENIMLIYTEGPLSEK
jgi:hypothetical protein